MRRGSFMVEPAVGGLCPSTSFIDMVLATSRPASRNFIVSANINYSHSLESSGRLGNQVSDSCASFKVMCSQ